MLSLIGAISALAACGSQNSNNNSNLGSGGEANATGGSAAGGGPAAGGSNTGGGASGGAASGGAPGSGGEGPLGSGGGDGTGGAPPKTGFQCPAGSESLTPSLANKTLTAITGVPEIVNNGGFLEGPVWYNGKLYLSQIDFSGPPPSGIILTYTPGGAFAPFLTDVGTNGLAVDGEGRLYATTVLNAGVISFNADDATEPPVDVARMYNGAVFNSPNDLTVRSDGTVYFTDPTHNCGQECAQDPVKGVYRVPPGGAAELITTTQDQPNGIALSPDESVLYVGGTSVTKHPVMADGSVGAGTEFGTGQVSDGLAVDCAGNVYLAQYTLSKLVILSPSGTPLAGEIAVQEPTNLAFGGPDNKTLYVTAFGDNRGKLYSVELEVPGFPY